MDNLESGRTPNVFSNNTKRTATAIACVSNGETPLKAWIKHRFEVLMEKTISTQASNWHDTLLHEQAGLVLLVNENKKSLKRSKSPSQSLHTDYVAAVHPTCTPFYQQFKPSSSSWYQQTLIIKPLQVSNKRHQLSESNPKASGQVKPFRRNNPKLARSLRRYAITEQARLIGWDQEEVVGSWGWSVWCTWIKPLLSHVLGERVTDLRNPCWRRNDKSSRDLLSLCKWIYIWL